MGHMRLHSPSRIVAVLLLGLFLGLGGCAGGLTASAESSRNDTLFARIALGMSMEEVNRTLGPPDDTMKFERSRTLAWDYGYQDPWGYIAIFSVTFSEDRTVVSKTSNRVNTGGDHQ